MKKSFLYLLCFCYCYSLSVIVIADSDNLAEAVSLNEQGIALYQQGKYAQAEPLYQRALAIREEVLGPEHEDTAQSLNNLAALYDSQGKYAQAEPLYQRAVAIVEKVLGPEHPHTATSLNNLAELYRNQGKYAEAEPLLQRALAIREKVLGTDHPHTASSLNNLAGLYNSQGKYAEAEPLLQRALAIREEVLGLEHPDTATSLNNLAALYKSQGKYATAEPLYQRALAIREEVLGPEHEDTAQSLNNLAGLYHSQGKYAVAEPLYQRSLAINEKVLGPEHSLTATSLNNLAGLYTKQGKYAEAEPLYQRAVAVEEKVLGPEHPLTATSLNNLAGLYESQGKYATAEPLHQRALAIRETVLGPEHPDTALSLNNLAALYYSQGKYAEAEPLYQRAVAIAEKVLGLEHPYTASSLNNLAWLYYEQGNSSQGLEYIRKASNIYHHRILANSRTASSSDDNERSGFKNTFVGHLLIAAARIADIPSMREELTAETFAIGQLLHDGTVGEALSRMTARFAAGSDKLATLARDKEDTQRAWQKIDAELITAIGKPTAEQNSSLIQNLRRRSQQLQTKLTNLNARLTTEFPAYAELTIPKPVTLAQTQQLLKPGEGLVAYALSEEKSFVWLITPDSASFRQLDRNSKDINTRVQKLRTSLKPGAKNQLLPFPVGEAYALYQDILAPEATQLTKITTLYVVADGALESLPFSILVTAPPPPAEPTIDYPQIAWLSRKLATVTLPTTSSLRALSTATTNPAATLPFIGFGNPYFGNDSSSETRGGMTLALTRGAIADPDQLRAVMPPLPDSATELKAIASILKAGKKTVILGKRATVPTVIATPLFRYRVIDFATHALVAGQIEEFKLGGEIEPAIVLTPPKIATADNDGLLRASQVAQLKLNADWVILSACNTAAPDGTPGAVGLSGLAKAFFYAGARAMLVSHWAVLSKPAVALTIGMFQEWQAHPELGRAEALRRSMMAMLDHPTDPRFTHPIAWAPFVVTGEDGGWGGVVGNLTT